MENSTKLAVIYCRVSGHAEQRSASIAIQEEKCRAYVAKRGYQVASVFVDNTSGRGHDRPGLRELLAYIAANPGRITMAVAGTTDRWMRVIDEYVGLQKSLRALGVTLTSVGNERTTSTDEGHSSPEDRFFAAMVKALREYDDAQMGPPAPNTASTQKG